MASSATQAAFPHQVALLHCNLIAHAKHWLTCPPGAFIAAQPVMCPHEYAGGVEDGSVTLDPCIQLVDRWVMVEEADIANAMVGLRDEDDLRLEGGVNN